MQPTGAGDLLEKGSTAEVHSSLHAHRTPTALVRRDDDRHAEAIRPPLQRRCHAPFGKDRGENTTSELAKRVEASAELLFHCAQHLVVTRCSPESGFR